MPAKLRRIFLVCFVLVAVCPPRASAQAAREDKFVDSAGVKIHYIDVGRGDPVILIHGFSSSLDANWGALGIIDKLAADFRVVALDAIIGRNDPLALAAVQRGNKDQAVTVMQVRAIKAPMLAVVGSTDPIKVGVDAFKRAVPSLQVVVIDGATHSGARGAPGRPEFVAAVHEFLIAHRTATSQ